MGPIASSTALGTIRTGEAVLERPPKLTERFKADTDAQVTMVERVISVRNSTAPDAGYSAPPAPFSTVEDRRPIQLPGTAGRAAQAYRRSADHTFAAVGSLLDVDI